MVILLLAVGFILRALPRCLRPNALNSDTYFHLFMARVLRENGFRLPRQFSQVVLRHDFTYPTLYHLFLALFPLKIRLWVERLSGAIFDTLAAVIVYAGASWLVESGSLSPAADQLPLWTLALFVFAPPLLRIGSGPRVYSGTPRVAGEMLYLLHILAVYFAWAEQSPLALAVGLLAGALMFLTAKFANQALVFFGLFFCLFVAYQYAFVIAGSFLLALLLSRGYAWQVVTGQVKHLIRYYKFVQVVYLYPHQRTLPKYLKSCAYHALNFVRLRWGAALRWYFHDESYFLHLLLTVNTPFIIALLGGLRPARSNETLWFLYIWCAAALTWFFLTKTRRMLFLGEGERYLEFAVFPSLFLGLVILLPGHAWWVYAWLGYSWVTAVFYLGQYLKTTSDSFNETEALFTTLRHMRPGVILPLGSFHWQTLYRSSFPVITRIGNPNEALIPRAESELLFGNQPYPSDRFGEILERYNVSYVLTDQAHLSHYRQQILKDPHIFDDAVELVCEASSLMLFRVKQ